jgi:uncharacterized membrane protein
VSELRGAIPFALYHGESWYAAWAFCAACNALVAPVCWVFLATLNKLFLKIPLYERFFERFLTRARVKLEPGIKKWGVLGVAAFVAIPLPMTGAWTGTLGAWVLGLSKRKTMLAVLAGVIISGGIVTALITLGTTAFGTLW